MIKAVKAGFSSIPIGLLLLLLAAGCSRAPKTKSAFELQTERTQRRKWREATLTGAYDTVGKHDPKWDEAAHGALDVLADIELNNSADQWHDAAQISDLIQTAVSSGCDDPLVEYLYYTWVYPNEEHSTNDAIQAYSKAAADMTGSSYSEFRKGVASLRYGQAILRLDKKRADLYGPLMDGAKNHFLNAMDDKDLPVAEAQSAIIELIDTIQRFNEPFPLNCYQDLRRKASARYPNTPFPCAIEGEFDIDYAWHARGFGYVDSVTPEGWKLFGERLKQAAAALEKGWRLDTNEPYCATRMLTVCKGLGKDREETELWWRRAMAADTNNYAACSAMLDMTMPKWGGSYDEMYALGRECVTNNAWGGQIPLIMVDAIWAIANDTTNRNEFLRQSNIWAAINKSYTVYFQKNPEAQPSRNNYIWYAYNAGAWDVLNQQVPLLQSPNYSYFGGKEAFDDIVRAGRAHAKK